MSQKSMFANYHTHTVRCMHAEGEIKEYVEYAISNGIKVLGFADHAPMPFDTDYSSYFRMSVDETKDYVDDIVRLREEYKDKIQILIGYEAEYYPLTYKNMLRNITKYECDYLIMGQHFLNNEFDGVYVYDPCGEEELKAYVNQVKEGLSTNVFSYLAHPDVVRFDGEDKVYASYMTELCEAAKELDIPLEFNLLGFERKRCYPREDFWRLVAKTGNKVIIGCDAHKPDRVGLKSVYNDALDYLKALKIKPIKELELKPVR